MKYVVLESAEAGRQTFAFPSTIEHSELAKAMSYIRHGNDRNWRRIKRELVESGVISGEQLSSEMKYIVTTSSEAGKQIFIFPKNIDHNRMADVLSDIVELAESGEFDSFYREPISAGFTNGRTCYGLSETLGLNSNPSDADLIQ